MKKTKLNLWPLLPVGIILLALLAAHLMPEASAEKTAAEPAGLSQE